MWYYHPLNRLGALVTKRLVKVFVIIAFVMVCCVCPMVFGLADLAVRQVGLLPTYTPRPPATPTPPVMATAVRPADNAWLRLRDVLDACQACQRYALTALDTPATVRLPDCLDARFDVIDGPGRLSVTLELGAAQPGAVRCEVARADGEWRLEELWLWSDGVWRPDDARRGD
jgi:hypothetical protein